MVLGRGDETRGKEHLVYVPHTDAAVSVSAACTKSACNTHVCVDKLIVLNRLLHV